MPTRRTIILGAGMSLFAMPAFARAPARTGLPSGGSVVLPNAYKLLSSAPRHDDPNALAAYRNYHSTMAGTNESDGMIAVGLAERFEGLTAFVRQMRGALTSRWSWSNESEGHWYGRPERFVEIPGQGANGEERVGKLVVNVVGWTVYDAPGCMYAVDDRRGVMIAVWIFEKHGGEKRARRYAAEIAASWKP
jgi:hypothetical protein